MSILYRYQERVRQLILQGKSLILQAPTGAGKTRAALVPFIQAFFDLAPDQFPPKSIYAVPMRVLANQFDQEYQERAASYQRRHNRKMGVQKQTGEYPHDREFAADLTFATIDQLLSSWLLHPYSLGSRLGNLNAGAIVGSYLIFDEFHLFDPDSTLPTTLQMLKTLNGISPFLLMTATFSQEMITELAQWLNAEPFLLTAEELAEIPTQNKQRRFHCQDQLLVQEGIAQIESVLHYHHQQTGDFQRSLVLFNQVERAQKFYEALRAAVPASTQVKLLHSRFRPTDRQAIEKEVRREFGKDQTQYQYPSLILVATQVVEVGLDMTSVALHTELAPAAAILQRAGRCARYPGEKGDVYLYPVEHFAPYHGTEAKAQCEQTQLWISQNQNRHLSFADEQNLINTVHTPTDQRILAGLKATSFEWSDQIQNLWQGHGDRGDANRLIRNIRAQSIVVHAHPEKLRHNPFAAELFSIFPGTLMGKYPTWLDSTAHRDFDPNTPEWAVKLLYEDKDQLDEEELPAFLPPRYSWKEINTPQQLAAAPLVALHPALVGYRADLGLTLYPSQWYESPVPVPGVPASYTKTYRLESYQTHIRLVHHSFRQKLQPFLAAATRLEKIFGWSAGIVQEMAELIICLHDAGKLDQKWQKWCRTWQKTIGKPHIAADALAHTDYDSDNAHHRHQEKTIKPKRPNHAVESALIAIPYLLQPVNGDPTHPLFRAAFSAIARHHAPFSADFKEYHLIPTALSEIQQTLQLLPPHLHQRSQSIQLIPLLTHAQLEEIQPNTIKTQLITPTDDRAAMTSYFLLVRALRHADQKGTQLGSQP